jgi:hypothetical protein
MLLALATFCAALVLAPEPGPRDAARLAAKALVAALLALAAAHVAALAHPAAQARRAPVAFGRWSGLATAIALAAGVVALVAVFAWPLSRLALNLAGYLSLALPLAWVVRRRAGDAGAALALLAFTVLCLGAGAVDARRAPVIEDARDDSWVKWTVGWPARDWVLRHEIVLDAPLAPGAYHLAIPLARRYAGQSRVQVRLNGHDLGAARLADEASLESTIPAELLSGQRTLSFELRADPPDPNLRLLAFRYGRGATRPGAASQYFDSQRWWTGTFDDAAGLPKPGIYVLRLVAQ